MRRRTSPPIPRYRRGCIHTILRGGLWRQDIKIISKPQWLIYERARSWGRKRKERTPRRRWKRGEALVKFSACGTAARSLQPRTSHPARNTSPFHSCLKPSLMYSATDLKDLRGDRVLRRRYVTQRYFPSRARNPAVYSHRRWNAKNREIFLWCEREGSITQRWQYNFVKDDNIFGYLVQKERQRESRGTEKIRQ